MVTNMARISANAIVPDQLLPYVAAVSGLDTELVNGCPLHHAAGQGVLVAYPAHDPLDHAAAEEAVKCALRRSDLEKLTILAARRPQCAPPEAMTASDMYWQIDLPGFRPVGKLANMLKRAGRELEITQSTEKTAWTDEHEILISEFCERKGDALDGGSVYLFQQLGNYLGGAPDAVLFSARGRDNSLAGLAIGDFTSLATAFYMFAFRKRDAPPGTSDLLLEALLIEACNRGHTRLNLGLGINQGIEFFKRKWGASRFLPYTETTWRLSENKSSSKTLKSWFQRLFGN